MAVSNVQINPLQYFKFSWTTAGADAANSSYNATIFQNQTDVTGVPYMNVPPNQIWKAVDVNIASTQTPAYTMDLLVGNSPQNININLNTTALSLGTTRINPFALMPNQGMLVGSATTLQIKIVSIAAATATVAATYSGNLGISAYPLPKK